MVRPPLARKPRPFFAFGNVVDATIAIGNVAHGTVAIGLSLSVGVVSIGVNAVGSLAAFGVNAAAPIAVAAVNAVGVVAIAGVNGFGAIGVAGVNAVDNPIVGLVIATTFVVVAGFQRLFLERATEPPERTPLPDLVPLAVARAREGWARVERVVVRGDRATIADRSTSVDAAVAPSLDATMRALASGPAFVELRVSTRPIADDGGYREAHVEEVVDIVNAMAAPPRHRPVAVWLARSPSTHLVFASVGLAAAIALAIATLW